MIVYNVEIFPVRGTFADSSQAARCYCDKLSNMDIFGKSLGDEILCDVDKAAIPVRSLLIRAVGKI